MHFQVHIEEDTARKYLDENDQIAKADFIKLATDTKLLGKLAAETIMQGTLAPDTRLPGKLATGTKLLGTLATETIM